MRSGFAEHSGSRCLLRRMRHWRSKPISRSVSIGPLTGKLVLSITATASELGAMRDKAAKSDHLATGIRKFTLNDADRQRAERMPLAAIAFIPAAGLDEAIILQRFGAPAERIRQDETLEHFLYPARGLDIVLDSKGKEVLQYVAPADFARLRAPLLKVGAGDTAATAK
jgi:hypothetical protein